MVSHLTSTLVVMEHRKEEQSRKATDSGMIAVPGPEDPWWGVGDRFALTYDAYRRVGSFDQVARVANQARDAFDVRGEVPDTIDGVRSCLFFEQRRWRHFDKDPFADLATKVYLQALLSRLRELTGGTLEGPSDDPF